MMVKITAMVIIRRTRHRFLALELTAFLASTDSGSAGNASAGGGCPSILFSALRIELNGYSCWLLGFVAIETQESFDFRY